MLKFTEHRPGQRSSEEDARQAWAERQRRKRERLDRRRQEAERFALRRRMIAGGAPTGEKADL